MTAKKPNTVLRTGTYMLRTVISILLYGVAVLVIIRGASRAYDFGYAVFSEEAMAAEGTGHEVYVTVDNGDTVKDVAKTLKKQKLIKDELVFEIQEKMSRYKDSLQPGTYILSTEQNVEEMLAILSGTNTEGQPGSDKTQEK